MQRLREGNPKPERREAYVSKVFESIPIRETDPTGVSEAPESVSRRPELGGMDYESQVAALAPGARVAMAARCGHRD